MADFIWAHRHYFTLVPDNYRTACTPMLFQGRGHSGFHACINLLATTYLD